MNEMLWVAFRFSYGTFVYPTDRCSVRVWAETDVEVEHS